MSDETTGVETEGTEAGSAVEAPAAPLLQIITPDTTPEEVAAIVAVFAALGGDAPAPEPARSEWAHPARRVRTPAGVAPAHGRGAWRASAFPR